jgi:sec-independent protein translocase protein TatB
MFDVGWSELVLIGVVALIVIGPKELPAVLRAVGQWTTKIRRMAGEFQSQFQEAMREAEMSDLKKQVDGLGDAVKFDPLDPDPLFPKEATKWEPKKDSAADSKTDSETEPGADSTPDSAPAAVPPETQGDVVTAAEPAAAGAAESSPGHSPGAAPDAAAASEPHPAVPLAEGSGRA